MGARGDARETAREIARECVGARVRMLNRLVSRIYDDQVRPHGLKFSQMNILTVVTLHGPVQPVEVARILSLEKSTLSRNVSLMEANGWLETLPGRGNAQLLRATAQGRRLLKKAAPGWRKAQKRVVSLLGGRTAAAVRRAVDRASEET